MKVMSQIFRDQDEYIFTLLSRVANYPRSELRSSLPSWVPDLVNPGKYYSGFSRFFKVFSASGNSGIGFSFEGTENEVLALQGIIVDSVREVFNYDVTNHQFSENWTDWTIQCYLAAEKADLSHTGESLEDMWWRLFICDLKFDRARLRKASEGYGTNYLKPEITISTCRCDGSTLGNEELGRFKTQYENTMWEVAGGNSFCVTEAKRAGWVPLYAKAGDKICIFTGAAAPFLIRERGDGSFELIGDAYIHGIMYGEALQGKQHNWESIKLA